MSPPLPDNDAARDALDRVGAGAALLCALHCAALPLMAGVLPLLGLGLLATDGFELAFVLSATVMASGAVWLTWRRHGRF
jgi:hypothetical protein